MDRPGHIGCVTLLLALWLAAAPGALAQDWIYDSGELLLNVGISSSMAPSGTASYVEAKLNLVPADDWRQDVVSISTEPSAAKGDGYYNFRWDRPSGELPFSLASEVKTRNDAGKVTERVIFPLDVQGYDEYLQPTKYLDSGDPGVAALASELASGKSDLYGTVSDMSHWVSDNIEYDPSCGAFVESASWTLSERRGTCDEYANLLIAMLRAVGIPARYVTGVAYSNLPSINGFGNHAWAEVYFPGHGWVPFDPTYGQHGYLDASHVKLQVSATADEPSVNYKWEGVGVMLNEKSIDISVTVSEKLSDASPRASVSAEAVNDELGFGSYGIVKSEIRNLKEYYISAGLVFVTPQQVDVIGDSRKSVWLKPFEKKTVYWLIKINEGLDPAYIYTLNFMVHTERNVSATGEFVAKRDNAVYTKEEAETYISARQEEEEKVYSRDVDLACAVETVYVDDPETVNCLIRNRGNSILEGLSVCMKQSCETVRLEIGQSKTVSFPVLYDSTGMKAVTVTASSEQVSKTATVEFLVEEMPEPEPEGFMAWINSFIEWLMGLFG